MESGTRVANALSHLRTLAPVRGKIYGLENELLDSALVLTFIPSDTTFTYHLNIEKYPPSSPLQSDDWIYQVSSLGNDQFKLLKTNILDSANKEQFLFNKDFVISKIIIVDEEREREFTIKK